ncbi:MAG TPA: SpvB/TcaC N-terminal domain-containing protein [Polyangiaceae bacterium]|nr:SpvB/TcaC N-terminal domain-containing protein [Polyangiaceae bacterium]
MQDRNDSPPPRPRPPASPASGRSEPGATPKGEGAGPRGAEGAPSTAPAGSAGSLLPSIALPKGGGALRGIGETFSTNPATGTGSLRVPLATSPGRAGFELGLSLGYDSGAGNGPFGLGWQLSTPAVTRKTDKGLPRYVDGDEGAPDTFVLSGAEDLVPVRLKSGSGTALDTVERGDYRVQRYRPRTEGLFARIERWVHRTTGDTHWRALTRDNVLNVYGRSPEARVADPEHPGRVFSWLLEETRDDKGNVARYTYKAEDGAGVAPTKLSESSRFETGPGGTPAFRASAQRYLKRIQYGNRTPLPDREAPAPANEADWLFEVVFDYGEHDDAAPTPAEAKPWALRQDPFSSYRATFEVRTYRLCRRVLMFHRFAELGPTPCLVRSTDFDYEAGPVVSYLRAVTQAGYQRAPGSSAYERATLPPLELGYAKPAVHETLRTLDAESLRGLPGGVEGAGAQWVDLDGEGIAGALISTERAWFYKANLGEGRLGPPALLRSLPSPAELGGGAQQLTDLGGDGNLDLVQYTPPLSGYFERTPEGGWAPFLALPNLPSIDWGDPNLRFLDLDGDGLPDLLLTERDAFVWCRSRGKEGFEPPVVIAQGRDEQKGPSLVFADGSETIQLADMSGDGLVDLVRVRHGEVCYWPNLGHGRFGPKVTLDLAEPFDRHDRFDPKRVRFADLDGSGPSDIVYLGREGVRLYVNQAGNAYSAPHRLASLPPIDPLSSLGVTDLLGQGTACLVWSSPLPGRQANPIAYVDLMGGKKPHLLESVVNNLGAETRLAYAPSTKFYLQDKAAGRPWLTRLAFPVQVLERVERVDHIARSRLVTRFAYHHGYFDGHEREFRGFARVDQWDAESFGGEKGKGLFPELPYDVDPDDDALNLPPVRTVTWFHTGAWLERERLELALTSEYYAADPHAPLLPDTTLPAGLSAREEREAARALRGQILRQEIYAEDGTPEAAHPYTVSERDYEVRLLQAAEGGANAVFFVHPRHTINLHYERRPNDPRMQHEVVLEVDAFGNVTRSAALAYPRRAPAEPEQARLWATLSEHTFANRPDESDWYRIGVPVETTTSELTGLEAPASGILSAGELKAQAAAAANIPYEATPTGGLQRRVVERERRLYYRDDLSGPLPFGQIESRALAHESYRLAFTPGLLTQAYGDRVTVAMLEGEGRYVQQDGLWWAPSGRAVFDADRFYLPVEALDPFGQRHLVRYDDYALLPLDVEDPLHNHVTSGLRDAAGNVTQNGNDYRTLAPALVSDANRNRVAAAFDALGMVVRTALMGKEGAGEGDTLDDPTTRLEYDLHRFRESGGEQPAFVRTLAREQHGPSNPRWQETYTYSDGSGREVMKKVQAEPGPVPLRDAAGRLRLGPDGKPETRLAAERWVGTGRTVFDNKGNPVKKYEPFFSDTFEYEDEKALVEGGVTPVLRYDPLGRLVRTDQPNGTHALVLFDAWRQETWDENDTVAGTPWLAKKQKGTPAEKRCAALALAHAGTPTVAHLDALGRTFLTVADNGPAGKRPTRVALDVEGNQFAVTDARDNMIQRQYFDLLGRPVRVVRADAGPRDATGLRRAVPVAADPDGLRTLADAAGKPVRRWDERGFAARNTHDALQRPTHHFARRGDDPERLVVRTIYGEDHPKAEARNLRSRPYQVYDGGGALTSARFDFKGNALETTRRLAKEYRDCPDWAPLAELTSPAEVDAAAEALLEVEAFGTQAAYDALNRLVSRTMSDGSETRPSYNEANLLEKVEVRIRSAAAPTPFVADVDYNARGQRERAEHANGTVAEYTYDPETFRLARLRATRSADGTRLQDLRYEYDPVGNVVAVADAVSFGNAAVSADGLYEYDALYQLTKAEGREHPGLQPSGDDSAVLRVDHPNDLQALVRYRETYAYDDAGNIEQMAHLPLAAGVPGWTRKYAYAPDSNRLLRTSAAGDPPGTLSATYDYDDVGSMTRLPHLPELRWDYADRLQAVKKQLQDGPGVRNDVFFAYDASGQRVRKVYEHGGLVEERIYLGDYEVYRKRTAGAAQPELERQTLHMMDDERRVALVETKTVDASVPGFVAIARQRYQLDSHLGSSTMEVDEAGAVIGYEEYHPYGSTALRAAHSAAEVSAKRYRYTGKERDEETGLYYHGARYYAAWLGRWSSADPAGLVDGPDLYVYGRNSPLVYTDPTGTWSWGKTLGLAAAVVVGVGLTAVSGGVLGPVAAGIIAGAAAGAVGEVVEAAVDGRPITAANVVASAAVGAALGGTFAKVGQLIAGTQVGQRLAARVVSSAIGQGVARAAYRVATSSSRAAGAVRAVASGVRQGVRTLEEAGEAVGRRLGGRFAENAAQQAGRRAALDAARADAAARAGNRGVQATLQGDLNGQSFQASTRSGIDRSGTGARAIETPAGRVQAPPAEAVSDVLRPLEVPGANGQAFERIADAEFKLFGYTLMSTERSASGTLYLGVTAPICPSCASNLWNTRAALPGVRIISDMPMPISGAAGAADVFLPPVRSSPADPPAVPAVEIKVRF